MCFSASASFLAASLLLVTGIYALKKVKSKKQIPLALIPLFFAFQQAAEGVIWLSQIYSIASPVIIIPETPTTSRTTKQIL